MADSSTICKNIFKDGKTTTSKDKFTSAWINLINQLEKSKSNRYKGQACFYLLRKDKNE